MKIEEEPTMVLALVLFLVTYAALMIFSKYRAHIALASAALFVILGILPAAKGVFGGGTGT